MKKRPTGTPDILASTPQQGRSIDIRYVALAALAIALGLIYLFVQFRGFSISTAMDQAQISREIAKGNGYTTQYIRPTLSSMPFLSNWCKPIGNSRPWISSTLATA